MSDIRYQDEETPVLSGPAPAPEPENPLAPISLVSTLTKAEVDQQIESAHAYPRSPAKARDRMIGLATMDEEMASECIFSLPRGGKQIRGPSIRFAEIALNSWGNMRSAARVNHEDRIERYVEAEAIAHDLETNVVFVARVRRRIELKRGKKAVDADMIQLAGAAAISIARRNAILGAIPKPVWRRALEAVESVVRGDQKTLVERRDAAIAYFNKAGVPTERILKTLEVNHLDDLNLEHLVDLNGMRSALKTGESTLDSLFPEERPPGPKPETLEEKLRAISQVDPQTGEITESGVGVPSPDGAGAADQPPSPAAPVSPASADVASRPPRPTRIDERLQKEGDAAAAKGVRALEEWLDFLTSDEIARVTSIMEKRWREIAEKAP